MDTVMAWNRRGEGAWVEEGPPRQGCDMGEGLGVTGSPAGKGMARKPRGLEVVCHGNQLYKLGVHYLNVQREKMG